MALITKLELAERNVRGVHDEVDCSYTVFQTREGHRFIQLNTFGTEKRKIQGIASQTIQLSEKAAHQLKLLIEQTYPHLK